MNQNYNGIDVLKYIMAISVIIIHVRVFANLLSYPFFLDWFISLAVPFFFVSSGFLITQGEAKTILNKKNFYRQRSLKLFRLWGIWLIIYLPINIYYYNDIHSPFPQALINYVNNVIVYGHSYLAWPLWYLYSYAIFCYLYAVINRGWSKIILVAIYISVPIINYLIFNIDGYITNASNFYNIYLYSHRTLGGGIYLLAGIFLYRIIEFATRNGTIIIIVLLAISLLLRYFELPFYQLLGGVAFFLLGLIIKFPGKNFWYSLRIQSMWVFYTHMFIIISLSHLKPLFPNHLSKLISSYTMVVVTIIFAIILGWLLWKLSQYPKFKLLNKLIK